MHHKRSKMKPEEELPSPGAVSIQVRKVDVKTWQSLASTLDILRLCQVKGIWGLASQVLTSPVSVGHPPGADIDRITSRCLHLSMSIWMVLILRCSQRKGAHLSIFR